MKGESLSSHKLSMKWCFLDCKSEPTSVRAQTPTCPNALSLSFRHDGGSFLQDRPGSGRNAAEKHLYCGEVESHIHAFLCLSASTDDGCRRESNRRPSD